MSKNIELKWSLVGHQISQPNMSVNKAINFPSNTTKNHWAVQGVPVKNFADKKVFL